MYEGSWAFSQKNHSGRRNWSMNTNLETRPNDLSLNEPLATISLYSTATQNTWRQGLALDNAPNARFLRWGCQHVGILEPTQALKFALVPTQNLKFALAPTPTPDASQWNIGGIGPSGVGAGVGHVHFIFFCRFHLRLVVNANPVSSGIWALSVHGGSALRFSSELAMSMVTGLDQRSYIRETMHSALNL